MGCADVGRVGMWPRSQVGNEAASMQGDASRNHCHASEVATEAVEASVSVKHGKVMFNLDGSVLENPSNPF